MNHLWRFMDIRVQRIGDANNNMNRIINTNIRCGRISTPTERRRAGNPTERENDYVYARGY